jgi:hypothetical protein
MLSRGRICPGNVSGRRLLRLGEFMKRSTILSAPHRRIAAVSVALIMGFGSLLAPAVAHASTSASSASASQVTPTPETEPERRATWTPYDNFQITSAANCESRRNWLIANVAWINQSNSTCTRFGYPATNPPKYYWLVMVRT